MISPTPIRLLIVRVSDKKTTPIETAVSGSSDPKMELVVAPAFLVLRRVRYWKARYLQCKGV